jgi:hypothetical protein
LGDAAAAQVCVWARISSAFQPACPSWSMSKSG